MGNQIDTAASAATPTAIHSRRFQTNTPGEYPEKSKGSSSVFFSATLQYLVTRSNISNPTGSKMPDQKCSSERVAEKTVRPIRYTMNNATPCR